METCVLEELPIEVSVVNRKNKTKKPVHIVPTEGIE